MEDYRYKLQYINGDITVTHEFPADLAAYNLVFHLRDFLCGCGWKDEQLDEILNLEGDEE